MNEITAPRGTALPAIDMGQTPFFDGPIADPQDDPVIHGIIRRNIKNPSGAALANCMLSGYPLIGFAYSDWQMEGSGLLPGYRAFCCAVVLNDDEVVLSPLLATTRAKTVWARMLRAKAIRFLQRKFRVVYVVTTEQRVQDRDHVLACGRGRTDGFIDHERAIEIDEIFNGATAFGPDGGIIVFDLARTQPIALGAIRGARPALSFVQRMVRVLERAFPSVVRQAATGAVLTAVADQSQEASENTLVLKAKRVN